MAANPSLSYPKPRQVLSKFVQVARTDTTAAIRAYMPKGALLVGMFITGAAASDAATTATIMAGTTSTATEWLAAYDVKTAATGEGFNVPAGAAVGSAFSTALTADSAVYVKYAETGTAS